MKTKISYILLSAVLPLSLISCGGLGEMFSDLYGSSPICVDSVNGKDTGDGMGWTNACKTIEAAAVKAGGSREIWVKNPYSRGSVDTISVHNTAIYGGFAGTERRREERNISTGTVISGSFMKFDIASNTRDITIDGFTFCNQNSGSQVINANSNVDLKVCNCTFKDIIGTGTSFYNCLYITSGNLAVDNCIFTNIKNTSQSGLSIYAVSSTVSISNSSFINNQAGANTGGAIEIGLSTLMINNCNFSYNSNITGGAVGLANSTNAVIADCTFTGNASTTGTGGGAIFNNSTGSLIIDTSTFNNNTASQGGAIYQIIGSTAFTITNSSFDNNSTTVTFGWGGAICAFTPPNIRSSTFSNNKAPVGSSQGGAIYSTNGPPKIEECSFLSNQATGDGGAVYSMSSSSIIINSLFYNNSTAANGGAVHIVNGPESLANLTFYMNSAALNGGALSIPSINCNVMVFT